MSVYEKKELVAQSFFQKLFKKQPKQNYMIELENKLFENENNLFAIQLSDISPLKEKYKISSKDFQYEREFLLNSYITHCLWDEHLSDDEKSQLQYLAKILDLSEDFLNKRITEEGKIIYKKKVQLVIADNKIEDSEKAELDALEKEFNISDSDSTEILGNEVSSKIQFYVDSLLAKRRISPDEEKKLNDMLSDMHVNASFSGDGITRFRKYWDIENAELVPMQSPINIQKSENMYFSATIDWYEERTRTTTISYGGIGAKFKICKGVYLRAGSIAPIRNTEEYLKFIDSGTIYFTNKRIIFMGEHGNKIIPFSKILSFTPYADGIEIDKETGKKPFFKYEDCELMGIYLARLLKDF